MRHCSPSGPVPPWGFAVEPWKLPLPLAGGKVGAQKWEIFHHRTKCCHCSSPLWPRHRETAAMLMLGSECSNRLSFPPGISRETLHLR